MRFIDDKSLERLGFKKLLMKVEPLSPYGKDRVKRLKNYTKSEAKELETEFERMEKFMEFSRENDLLVKSIEGIIHRLKDIKTVINNCLKGSVLDDVDFFELKLQSMLMSELSGVVKKLPSELESFRLKDVDKIVEILDPEGEKTPTFYIYDSYSLTLKDIRARKKEVEKQIFGTSDVERITALKEKRLSILLEEEAQESEIRKELSAKMLNYAQDLLENIDKIGNLDFLMAKVKFAQEYGGIRAKISEDMYVSAKGLINIEVKEMLEIKGKEFTPIDIELSSGTTVITGANMGGKSVALKTITENILLFNYGFFVVAREATLPIVDFVFFVSDDMQDISKGLSTFGAEIMKLKEVNIFLERGVGFVVFDEFARGTNPKEGQKFVKALANSLNTEPSISLITTHFDGIAQPNMNHYEVVGLKNVDFEKLRRKIEISDNSMSLIQDYMDYRLAKTDESEVPKDALNIAKLIGINEKFAKEIMEEYSKED